MLISKLTKNLCPYLVTFLTKAIRAYFVVFFFGEEMKTCGDNSNTNHNDKLKLFEHQ